MNGKALIPLVAGLAIGGFALWMGVNTLRSMKGAQRPVQAVEVWAARDTITRGTEITEEMLQPMPFPAGMVPQGASAKKEEIVGRVPRVDAPAGLPVLQDMLLPPGARSGLHVKPGFRAVAVKIDESSGVDYHVEPGAFVDVVGSFQTRRSNQTETLARTLVENVEIAAVGTRISAADGKDEGEKSNQRTVRAVTLFVRPEDVPKLLLAEQKGKIKLSLRGEVASGEEPEQGKLVSDLELTGQSRDDENVPATPPGGSLMDQIRKLMNPPAPAPVAVPIAPPPPPPVEAGWEVVVYRGDSQVKSVRFKNRDSAERIGEKETEEAPSLFGNPPRKPADPPPPAPPADTGDDVSTQPTDEPQEAKESQE